MEERNKKVVKVIGFACSDLVEGETEMEVTMDAERLCIQSGRFILSIPIESVEKYIKGEEYEPEYLGENVAIGCRDGECKCGNIVRSYQNYCCNCGIKLNWGNVHSM